MRDLPNGYTKIPWGFIQDDKGLVAVTSVKDRNERAELGEFAIELLGRLGVTEKTLLNLQADPSQIELFIGTALKTYGNLTE